MTETTLNVPADEGKHPGLRVAYVIRNGATITYWFDDQRIVRHWRSTDYDHAGWSVAQEAARRADLVFDQVE